MAYIEQKRILISRNNPYGQIHVSTNFRIAENPDNYTTNDQKSLRNHLGTNAYHFRAAVIKRSSGQVKVTLKTRSFTVTKDGPISWKEAEKFVLECFQDYYGDFVIHRPSWITNLMWSIRRNILYPLFGFLRK